MQSQSSSLLRLAALVVAVSAPVASMAASETFPNGQSIYGQPASATSATRAVDLSQAARVNVVYGETIAFRGEAGQQFAWTFNGLDRRAVDLARIAPPGFSAKAAVAYVGRDPANRR